MDFSARLAGRIAAAILLTGFLALPARAPVAQTQPAGTDEATLYNAAKKEGSIVFYESGPLEANQAIMADFEKKYPGIHGEVLRFVGVAQYQRFVQEIDAKQYIADILSISDQPSVADLITRGHIAEWKVPTHDRYPADVRIGASSYSPGLNDNVVVYNTNKVTPEEIKLLSEDWKGVLDPRFKGRIAITDQKCGACYALVHMALDPKMKDRYGMPFLEAFAAQKPTIYNDIVTVVDRVVAGEKDIGYWPAEGIPSIKFAQGAPVRWLHPKPTPLYGGAWLAVSKYAPHPNAARLFQNWMTSEEGVLSYQIRYGGLTALEGVADARTVTKESWYQSVREKYVPDWKRWTEDYDKDMAVWSKLLHAQQ